MEVRLIIITGFLLFSVTRSQYFPVNSCQIEKKGLGDRQIELADGSEVRGYKVLYKHPQSTNCQLKSVEEFRGLQYGVLKLSDKLVYRFHRNKDPVRAPDEDTHRFATNHKPVCPQLRLDPTSPRWKMIADFTNMQSEECLWLNIFVPDTGKEPNYLHLLQNSHLKTGITNNQPVTTNFRIY